MGGIQSEAKTMINWFIDKDNKVPLYLQLKDQIKYYISTGVIQDNHQLPGVNKLARDLSINFETVRKAYKELEKEGLISMQRAKGTFATLHKAAPTREVPLTGELSPMVGLRTAVRRLLETGKNADQIRALLDRAFEEATSERARQLVIFTECNQLQVHEISRFLEDYLKLKVDAVLLKDLKDELQRILKGEKKLKAIVTTGFHVNDVREIIGAFPVDIHILITNMSPETRRQIEAFGKGAGFGFICRDEDSIQLYKELLKAELGSDLKLSTSYLGNESEVESVLSSVDVLLVTPPVYKTLKKRAPIQLPVFNVFDRVDPMSLRLLRDRLQEE